MTISLSPEARARLDAHLDAVERALIASGHSRESRRGIVDDLEAQILDMLAAKSPNPALADVEAVLATLDPPAAYGENAPPAGTGTAAPESQSAPCSPGIPKTNISDMTNAAFSHAFGPQPTKPRYSRTAIVGFVCILMSLVPILLTVPALFVWRSAAVSPPVESTEAPASKAPATLGDGTPASPVSVEGPTSASAAPSPATAASATYYEHSASWKLILTLFIPCTGVSALAGTILGWIALFQIRASKGALRGTGLALFDGLFYVLPFVLIAVLYEPLIAIAFAALIMAVVLIRYWPARV